MVFRLFVYCILLYIAVFMLSAELIINNYVTSKANGTQYGDMLVSVKVVNELACLSKCSEDEQCNSATFDDTSKICNTNRVAADASVLCNGGDGCAGPDVVAYMEKDNGYATNQTSIGLATTMSLATTTTLNVATTVHIVTAIGLASTTSLETTVNHACQSDADCLDPSSLCAIDTCQCEPGYSFDGSGCVTSCVSYGTTFQVDHGHKINMNDDITLNAVSLEQCKSACITEASFVCRSFEYKSSHSECSLQAITALDMPNKYMSWSSKDYYTRDCSY